MTEWDTKITTREEAMFVMGLFAGWGLCLIMEKVLLVVIPGSTL